ncbi:hypothetical protein ES703_88169 [subsurface metagenome]
MHQVDAHHPSPILILHVVLEQGVGQGHPSCLPQSNEDHYDQGETIRGGEGKAHQSQTHNYAASQQHEAPFLVRQRGKGDGADDGADAGDAHQPPHPRSPNFQDVISEDRHQDKVGHRE